MNPLDGILIDLDGLAGLVDPIFVDTRKHRDFARGHIPGAFHLDTFRHAHEDTSAEGLRQEAHAWRTMFAKVGLGRQGSYVFYDVGLENRAPRPAIFLRALGHPRSYVLAGGFYAWVKAGHPVETGRRARRAIPPDLDEHFDTTFLVGFDYVRARLGGGAVLLDVREPDEYHGKRVQRNPRVGRIPGALHVPWTAFTRSVTEVPPIVGRGKYATHILAAHRSADEIRACLLQLGVQPEQEVIVYCQKSHRASAAALALAQAGFPNVKIYIGSFREWSRRRELPVEAPRQYRKGGVAPGRPHGPVSRDR